MKKTVLVCDFCGSEYTDNEVKCYSICTRKQNEHGVVWFEEKDICDGCRQRIMQSIRDIVGKKE